MGFIKRKSPRLKGYDYTQNGAYFITICTKNKKHILSDIVDEGFHALPNIQLSAIGVEIEKSIQYANRDVKRIVKYVIMPNHVHLLVELYDEVGHGNLTLQEIIGALKSYTTKQWNIINGTQRELLWQRSFHDHVIRNQKGYEKIWNYIDINPAKWQDDCYYEPPQNINTL